MKVEVVCFGAMRDFLPDGASGNRAALDIQEGGSVGDAVDALGAPRPLVFALLVNGARANLDTRLGDGDEITLMPPFSGGATARST